MSIKNNCHGVDISGLFYCKYFCFSQTSSQVSTQVPAAGDWRG